MADIIAFRPEAVVDAKRELWVRTMCLIAGVSDRTADDYLFRRTPRRQIALELWAGLHGRNGVGGSSSLVAYMRGPHRPDRRALPIHPATYGIRRPA